VHLYRADRDAERAPKNYRTMSAHALASAANSDEDAVRKTISRVRQKIRSEFRALYGREPDLDAVVENVPGKGYRLNPAVRVVTPDQLRS
jgi:DNA-binding winged helix-turn-helix (wHTH) protein